MDRIPTEELKQFVLLTGIGAATVPMDRIPTEELKLPTTDSPAAVRLGPNGQNSDRGIETITYHQWYNQHH